MEKIQLTAEARIQNQNPTQIRNSGRIPAVLYGHGVENMNLTVNAIEFQKALRSAGESTIVELNTGSGVQPVLIHDVQLDPVKSNPVHVDFYQVNLKEKLTATVQIEFTGEAPAVKTGAGTLVKVMGEVEVESLPQDLPHNLTVDISSLTDFDKVILVSNIVLPKGVEMITDGEEVVAKVQPPRDVEAELAEPVVEDISKVEGAAETKPEAAPAAKE